MQKFNEIAVLMIFCLVCTMAGAQTCTGSSTRNITVENCSAATEASSAMLRIFPNPARDVIALQNNGERLFFELFDLLGNKILEKELPENETTMVNVDGLFSGIYLAKWRTMPFGKAAFWRIEILR